MTFLRGVGFEASHRRCDMTTPFIIGAILVYLCMVILTFAATMLSSRISRDEKLRGIPT